MIACQAAKFPRCTKFSGSS